MHLNKICIFLCALVVLVSIGCARRERDKTIVITTERPNPSTTIFSDSPPKETGTVIMVTKPATEPATTAAAPVQDAPVGSTTTTGATAQAPVLSVTTSAPPPPPPITAVEVGTGSTTEKVGLLECDSFVDRYVSCINRNVPADQQGPMIRSLETSIKRWQSMMSTPTGQTDAKNECQSAFDRTKQAMTPYGCAWQ